jgi:hypothetical protein
VIKLMGNIIVILLWLFIIISLCEMVDGIFFNDMIKHRIIDL